MALTLTAAPTIEPVSLDEMKAHLHYPATDQDGYISALISAARQSCESETDRAFLTQTWTLAMEYFPSVIFVPRPPLQSVAHIVYYDENGEAQTLDEGLYQVDTFSEPGRIAPARGCSWPSVDDETMLPVRVSFVAGWDSSDDVPGEIKHAVKLLTAQWFETLTAVTAGAMADVPNTIKMLLTHWKTF